MNQMLNVLKALSDETRLRILNLLYERELCVCDVMGILQISQAKASRHLIYLKNAGLVKDRKHAQWAYYSLSNNKHLKFVDALVYDNLRSMDLYADDLKNLAERLQKGENECEHA